MTDKEFKHRVLSLSGRVYPLAARLLGNDKEAEDAVQDIMIKLWHKKKQLAKHPNVNGFVFLTARNYCLDLIKSKKKFVISERPVESEAEKINDDDKEYVKGKFKKVQKIINQLPDQQREIILMRDLDGLEFDEISESTGYKQEHIRVILSRARKSVRETYQKANKYEKRAIR